MKRLLIIAICMISTLCSCEKSSDPTIIGTWNVDEVVWIGSVVGFDTPTPIFKKTHEYAFDDDGILTERDKESLVPSVGVNLYPYVFNGNSLILMKKDDNLVLTVKRLTDTLMIIEKGEYQYNLTRK